MIVISERKGGAIRGEGANGCVRIAFVDDRSGLKLRILVEIVIVDLIYQSSLSNVVYLEARSRHDPSVVLLASCRVDGGALDFGNFGVGNVSTDVVGGFNGVKPG